MLIAENDPLLRSLLSHVISTIGCVAVFATDGISALRTIEENKQYGCSISLVITDVDLPGIDGLQLIKQTAISKKEIPFIVITASDRENEVKLLSKEMNFDYITKPFDIKDIIDMINKHGI